MNIIRTRKIIPEFVCIFLHSVKHSRPTTPPVKTSWRHVGALGTGILCTVAQDVYYTKRTVEGWKGLSLCSSLQAVSWRGTESLWGQGAISCFAKGSHGRLTCQKRLTLGQTSNQCYQNDLGERLNISRKGWRRRMWQFVWHLKHSVLAINLYNLFRKAKILQFWYHLPE